MIKTKEEFLKELKKRFPNNKIEILEYSGVSKPIKYKCLNCERIYTKNRANHLYENQTLCQKCYSAKLSNIRNKFINLINKRKDLEILGNIGATSQQVKLKCLKCNRDFEVKMSNFIQSNNHSCPFCGKNGSPVDEIEFRKRMKKFDKEDYEIIKYKNFTTSVILLHKNCGKIFSQLPANFLRGRGCPHCYKKISKGEQKIINFLLKNNITFEFQKTFLDLKQKSYDFYLPKYNLLIEYQGEQHFTPIPHFGGEEKFLQQQKRDLEKKEFAELKGIQLIEISYKDFDKIENLLSELIGSTTIPLGVDSSESKKN